MAGSGIFGGAGLHAIHRTRERRKQSRAEKGKRRKKKRERERERELCEQRERDDKGSKSVYSSRLELDGIP